MTPLVPRKSESVPATLLREVQVTQRVDGYVWHARVDAFSRTASAETEPEAWAAALAWVERSVHVVR